MRTDFIHLSKGQIDTQIMFASHKIPYDRGSNTNYFSFFPHLSHIPVGATTFFIFRYWNFVDRHTSAIVRLS